MTTRGALVLSLLLLAGCNTPPSVVVTCDNCPQGTSCEAGAECPADSGVSPAVDGGERDGGHLVTPVDAGTSCGPCNSPPSECHARTGTCVGGVCEYAFIADATCDDGNDCTEADTCRNGACRGTPKLCAAPPSNVCESATEMRAFDGTGSCQGGRCIYGSKVVACGSGGCTGGSCQTDPCANVVCNSPPNGCFTGPGVCQNGSCSYPFANGASCNDSRLCTTGDVCNSGVCQGVPKACNTPPASVCENASTLRVYSSTGTCAGMTGQCSYTFGFLSCGNGCANGACIASGWTVMSSNVTVNLRTVWAASPNSAWAGGENGTLVYFNGAQWQVRASGTTSEITHIHGTAANDVFALTGLSVLHYDGTQWSTVHTLPLGSYSRALSAVGPNTALVYSVSFSGSSTIITLSKVQLVGGTWQYTNVANGGMRRGSNNYLRMSALSPNSVYLPGGNHWDGSMVKQLATATYLSTGPGKMAAAGDLVLALDWQNGATPIYRYDASQNSWVPMATGFAGVLNDLHAVAPNRVFAVGQIGGAQPVGHVLYFDGAGWTDESLPQGVGYLYSVSALPSGEVFAVGNNGLILKGP